MNYGSEQSDSFRVLVVCTGNICRSPIAEQLLRSRTSPLAGIITVSSAGTYARAGEHMTPEAEELSSSYGGDPADHRAAELTPRLVAGADLILTATRAHRAEIVSMIPRASRTTFTLRQFARLLELASELGPIDAIGAPAGGAERLNALVAFVNRNRGLAPPLVDPIEDDIVDPYRREQAIYDEAGRNIDDAVNCIARAIGGYLERCDSGEKSEHYEASLNANVVTGPKAFRSTSGGNND